MNRVRGWAIAPAGMPATVLAADAVHEVSTFGVISQALFALLVVLGLLYLFVWLLRRFGPTQGGAQGVVKVVGGVMLGPRERLVVVEVENTWVLVGVAAGHVSALHTLPRPAGAAAAPLPAAHPFAERLAELLRRPSR